MVSAVLEADFHVDFAEPAGDANAAGTHEDDYDDVQPLCDGLRRIPDGARRDADHHEVFAAGRPYRRPLPRPRRGGPLAQRLGLAPTATELAAELGVDRDEVVQSVDAAVAYRPSSLDAPASVIGSPNRLRRDRASKTRATTASRTR